MQNWKWLIGTLMVTSLVLAQLLTGGAALAQSGGNGLYLPYVGHGASVPAQQVADEQPAQQLEMELLTAYGPRLQAAAELSCTMNCVGFPDTDPTTGRFINVTRGLSSLGDFGPSTPNLHLRVPKANSSFQLSIFDADIRGLWDRLGQNPLNINPLLLLFNTTFHLYPDPNLARNDSVDEIPLSGGGGYVPDNSALKLDDNTWVNFVVANGPAGAGLLDPCNTADNYCYYHLVVEWNIPVGGDNFDVQNNFKVAVEGTPFLLSGSTIGFVGLDNFSGQPPDLVNGVFPDYSFLPTDYMEDGGRFVFFLDVPAGAPSIDVWDGDFDVAQDKDDGNSPDFPPTGPGNLFAALSSSVLTETARDGVPADDNTVFPYKVIPNVFYTIESADGSWTVTNDNPSGDQEWERYQVGTAGATEDVTVGAIPEGMYRWEIGGLDRENTVFLTSEFDVLPAAELGDTVWIDENNNGIWEPGTDTPVANALVELYRDVDNSDTVSAGDVLAGTMLTDGNGFYLFTGLSGGEYVVRVASSNFDSGGVLDGYAPSPISFPDATANPADDLNRGSPHAVTLVGGESYRLADFAYVRGGAICVWDPDDPANQAGIVYKFEVDPTTGANIVTIRVTFSRSFADTAYGPNSTITGWPGKKGRKFDQILGSDNLELLLKNSAGIEVLKFKIDLLAKDPTAPSGYRTGGVSGDLDKSDGGINKGDEAWILAVKTSISENLNNTLWPDFENSPLVDAAYNFDPSVIDPLVLSEWDWSTWYEVTIDLDAAFGGMAGFDEEWVPYSVSNLHSSPSKTGDNSPSVEPCPDDIPRGEEPCQECDGKVTRLSMRYLGITDAYVEVFQKKDQVRVFEGTLAPNEEFTFNGKDKHGTLGTEIEIFVDGALHTRMHTSCSQPIGPGLITGDFLVTLGESRNGGLMCALNACAPQPVQSVEFDGDKLKWDVTNTGDLGLEVERVKLEWPASFGNLKEMKVDGRFWKGSVPAPTANIDKNWDGNVDDRTIKAGDTRTFEFKFNNDVDLGGDVQISIDFASGCSIQISAEALIGGRQFTCDKPIDSLTMIWDGLSNVDVTAWKGSVGSTSLGTVTGLAPGDQVTFVGFAGSPNDVYWEVVDATTGVKLGDSKFHLSCSDNAMDGPEDCGARQGNGKSNDAGLLNDWILEGIVDATATLNCTTP